MLDHAEARISPWTTTNQASEWLAQLCQASAHAASSSRDATPSSTARSASGEAVVRWAHVSAHHDRSPGLAKHQTDAEAVTSVKPAARAQAIRRRPASGSPPLARATVPYTFRHRSRSGVSGHHVIAA